jgi:hypothetical protein
MGGALASPPKTCETLEYMTSHDMTCVAAWPPKTCERVHADGGATPATSSASPGAARAGAPFGSVREYWSVLRGRSAPAVAGRRW